MVHSVQLIVGRGEPIALFLGQWPGARAVALRGPWQAIPVDETLHQAIEAGHPGAIRLPELDLAPQGLDDAMMAATTGGGGLVYVETDYFGGAGAQSAMAIVDGRERMAAQRSQGGGGPINQALRAVGVMRLGDDDEFDTIALGERRTMEDYEPEGPRRLRAAAPVPSTARPPPDVPMWLVMLLIAIAVGAGVMAAVVG